MKNNTKHLYIHIPFCKHICTYCDFVRKTPKDNNEVQLYLQKIIAEIDQFNNICKTIYIGGGTPNYLNDEELSNLLSSLQKNIDQNTEFTIEMNPEFVTENQVKLLKKFKVNRISLGVQTNNEKILKLLNRKHNNETVSKAIEILQKHKLDNISCDFIYNLPLLKISDLTESFKFVKKHNIKHLSFYALEIKDGSIMNKRNEKINVDIEEDQLEFIEKELLVLGYKRYEVSNWCIDDRYKSKHNLAYWTLKDWKAIGIGAYGYENDIYYNNEGEYLSWEKKETPWDKKETSINILIMGLRLVDGIDLSIQRNLDAYYMFKDKIDTQLTKIENNFLKANNIDLLNDILINLID